MGGHTPLQSERRQGRAQRGKAFLRFAAPITCSWSMGPQELLPSGTIGARAGIHPARDSRGSTGALHSSGIEGRNPLHQTIWANLVRAQICSPQSGKTPMGIFEHLLELVSWS